MLLIEAHYDVVVQLARFQNLALAYSGVYAIQAFVTSSSSSDDERAIPYHCFVASSSRHRHNLIPNLSKQHPASRPRSGVINHEQGTFRTRPFVVRYENEAVTLNEGVHFRLSRPVRNGEYQQTFYLHLQLLCTPLPPAEEVRGRRQGESKEETSGQSFETVENAAILSKVTNDEALLEVVASQTLRLSLVDGRVSAYFPVTWKELYFCLADTLVHSTVSNVRMMDMLPSSSSSTSSSSSSSVHSSSSAAAGAAGMAPSSALLSPGLMEEMGSHPNEISAILHRLEELTMEMRQILAASGIKESEIPRRKSATGGSGTTNAMTDRERMEHKYGLTMGQRRRSHQGRSLHTASDPYSTDCQVPHSSPRGSRSGHAPRKHHTHHPQPSTHAHPHAHQHHIRHHRHMHRSHPHGREGESDGSPSDEKTGSDYMCVGEDSFAVSAAPPVGACGTTEILNGVASGREVGGLHETQTLRSSSEPGAEGSFGDSRAQGTIGIGNFSPHSGQREPRREDDEEVDGGQVVDEAEEEEEEEEDWPANLPLCYPGLERRRRDLLQVLDVAHRVHVMALLRCYCWLRSKAREMRNLGVRSGRKVLSDLDDAQPLPKVNVLEGFFGLPSPPDLATPQLGDEEKGQSGSLDGETYSTSPASPSTFGGGSASASSPGNASASVSSPHSFDLSPEESELLATVDRLPSFSARTLSLSLPRLRARLELDLHVLSQHLFLAWQSFIAISAKLPPSVGSTLRRRWRAQAWLRWQPRVFRQLLPAEALVDSYQECVRVRKSVESGVLAHAQLASANASVRGSGGDGGDALWAARAHVARSEVFNRQPIEDVEIFGDDAAALPTAFVHRYAAWDSKSDSTSGEDRLKVADRSVSEGSPARSEHGLERGRPFHGPGLEVLSSSHSPSPLSGSPSDWSPSFSSPSFASACSSPPHLIVFQHGFQGRASDLRKLKNRLLLLLPPSPRFYFLLAAENQADTNLSIADMGQRLAMEVVRHLRTEFAHHTPRISFVGHSMGGLIIRAALTCELFQPYLSNLCLFLSLSSPHLGCRFAAPVIHRSMQVMQKLLGSTALKQLMMADGRRETAGGVAKFAGVSSSMAYSLSQTTSSSSTITASSSSSSSSAFPADGPSSSSAADHEGQRTQQHRRREKRVLGPGEPFLYRLSMEPVLEYFERIVLVSIQGDHYIPRHSARIEICEQALTDSSEDGQKYIDMVASLQRSMDPSKVVRLHLQSSVKGTRFDQMTGRAAHISVLDQEPLVEMLAFFLQHYLDPE